MNAAAPHGTCRRSLPAPGESDWLMTVMAVFLVVVVVSVGLIYLRLHALPEQMAESAISKVQMQFVAVLALLALFTHNHVFWIVPRRRFCAGGTAGLLDADEFDRAVAGKTVPGATRRSPIAASDGTDLLSDDKE